jgi:hypothetical protein
MDFYLNNFTTIAGSDGVVYLSATTNEGENLDFEINAYELYKDLPAIFEFTNKAYSDEQKRIKQDHKNLITKLKTQIK